MNCDEAVFWVQNASLDMLRELYVELGEASYWLKLESYNQDGEEWMAA